MHPNPRLWWRYVDDRFFIQKEVNKHDFLQHINSVDPAIQFTVENNKEDGAIPFLDTIVKPEADGNLSITVYRKSTHTDQYLQWDSHHHLSAKFSVINTLTHRAQTVCSNPELLHKEMDHLRKVFLNVSILNGLWTRGRKGLIGTPGRLLLVLTIWEPQAPSPLPMKSKQRVILLYLIHKVSVKASRRSVGCMAYRTTSKVVVPSITYWSPPRTKTPQSAKVGPYIGSNVVTSPVMRNR